MSTLISWSDEVWNPTTGCDRVSPGCANCYALKQDGALRSEVYDTLPKDLKVREFPS